MKNKSHPSTVAHSLSHASIFSENRSASPIPHSRRQSISVDNNHEYLYRLEFSQMGVIFGAVLIGLGEATKSTSKMGSFCLSTVGAVFLGVQLMAALSKLIECQMRAEQENAQQLHQQPM